MNQSWPTDETRENAEALLQGERLFSDPIITGMPGVLCVCDPEGRFLRWNRALETVSGYSTEEVARMHSFDFFADHQEPLLKEKMGEAFSKGESSLEVGLITKEGRHIPFFFTHRKVMLNGTACLVGLGIDVAEREQAGAALQESERKYRELVEHANSIIVRWTRDGCVTFLNEYGLKFFDYTAEEIIG